MEAQVVEQFLKVNGPWALVAVLLFMLWSRSRGEDKSTVAALALMNQVLGEINATLKELNQCLAAVRDVTTRVEERTKTLTDLYGKLADKE